MDRCKYIVVPGQMGNEDIILFPASRSHDSFKSLRPISAGFVTPDDTGKFRTGGWSSSLNLLSREEDQILLDCLLKK